MTVQALKALGDKVAELEGPDGAALFDVPGGQLPAEDTPAPPRLLPMWDSVLLAYADRSRVIPPDYRRLFIHQNGDVLPTLLVDGYVAGVWRPAEGGIEATAFHKLSKEAWRGLATEARRSSPSWPTAIPPSIVATPTGGRSCRAPKSGYYPAEVAAEGSRPFLSVSGNHKCPRSMPLVAYSRTGSPGRLVPSPVMRATASPESSRNPVAHAATIVGRLWTSPSKWSRECNKSWISHLAGVMSSPYCRSCPKGPRTSSDLTGTCIGWSI